MNIYLLVELILKGFGLWEGLNDYIQSKNLDEMRAKLLKIHLEEENIKKADDEKSISDAQSIITRNT